MKFGRWTLYAKAQIGYSFHSRGFRATGVNATNLHSTHSCIPGTPPNDKGFLLGLATAYIVIESELRTVYREYVKPLKLASPNFMATFPRVRAINRSSSSRPTVAPWLIVKVKSLKIHFFPNEPRELRLGRLIAAWLSGKQPKFEWLTSAASELFALKVAKTRKKFAKNTLLKLLTPNLAGR
jgi:hypothetical protein